MSSHYSPYYRTNPHQQQSRPGPRKVVTIPVQYVGPETKPAPAPAPKPRQKDPVAYVVKIQKVSRGFLVRRSLRKIAAIKAEVDEVGRKVESGEIAELIRRDHKEWIRVSEALMSLLLKLDSVRGVDLGVKEFRKSVIKRAIALQEKVDGIAANVNNPTSPVVGAGDVSGHEVMDATLASGDDQTLGGADNVFSPVVDQVVDNVVAPGCDQTLGVIDNFPSTGVEEVTVDYGHDRSFEAVEDVPGPVIDEVADEEVKELGVVEEQKVAMDIEDNCDDVKEDCCDWIEEDMGTDLVEDGSEFVIVDPLGTTECGEVNDGMEDICAAKDGEEKNAEQKDEGKLDKELPQKMMEDHEKMMDLMKQLAEKNEKQAQMLNSLTRRVEQMEKALVYLLTREEKMIA